MKNFVQDSEIITLTAPYAVTSGQALKVGAIVAVATTDAAINAAVEAVTRGVVDLAKLSAQAWALGDRVYWDDTAKLTTTVSAGNTLIGVAIAVAANPSAAGRVRLNGSYT